MIVFTMQLLEHYTRFQQFWIFIGFQWVMFAAVYMLSAVIPDIPPEVELQVERAEYIEKKLIEKMPDEAEDDVRGSTGNRASFNLENNILAEMPSSLAK
jgi:hypothetical protein